jgi:hypothetical protein
MGQRKTISLDTTRGQWGSGDPAIMPDGYCRKVRNMVLRPNRWEQRPPFTYDGTSNVKGLSIFNDGDGYELVSHTGTAPLRDYTNHQGRLIYLTSNGFGGAEYGVATYDGSTISFEYLGGGSIFGGAGLATYTLAAFRSRLFFGGLTLKLPVLMSDPYDPTAWTLTNVTAANIASGSTSIGRVTPTNTTASKMSHTFATSTDPNFTWLCPLRGTHPTYRMPVTLSVRYAEAWVTATAYTAGHIIIPTTANNFRYRCTVAGTSGAGEPVWPVAVGGTVADGTATWICDDSDVVSSTQQYVPNATDSTNFTTFVLQGAIPASAIDTTLRAQIDFNHGGAAITLASVDMSYEDGLADGTINKANYLQQVTNGTFIYPFSQNDTTWSMSQRDYIYWTEIGITPVVRSTNFIRLTDHPGNITAVRPVQGRLVAFKRNAAWVFSSTDDPDLPIIPDGDAKVGFGCLGPKALDVFEDIAYFIGENEIYAWDLSGPPRPLCGDAMRETIMNKVSTSWVESQATYNTPLLRVDAKNREVWVYTQKGILFCYDIDEKAWSQHDAGGGSAINPVGYEIRDMIFNPNTGNMYFAFGTAAAGTAGLARLDPTATDAEDSISTSGTLPVYSELWTRPIETSGPRSDITVECIRIHHAVTTSQTSQTTTAAVSYDHGITFPNTNQVTLSPVSTGGYAPMEIPLYESWGSILPRVIHVGKGGKGSFNVSQVEVDVQVERGEFQKAVPTAGSATL